MYNIQAGGEQSVHCSEVVPSSEVEMYNIQAGGEQSVHCTIAPATHSLDSFVHLLPHRTHTYDLPT